MVVEETPGTNCGINTRWTLITKLHTLTSRSRQDTTLQSQHLPAAMLRLQGTDKPFIRLLRIAWLMLSQKITGEI